MANLENILTLNLKGTSFLHLKKQRYTLHTPYAILQVYINDYQTLLVEQIRGEKEMQTVQ